MDSVTEAVPPAKPSRPRRTARTACKTAVSMRVTLDPLRPPLRPPEDSMQFRIGPHIYTAFISKFKIIHENEEVLGILATDGRVIAICSAVHRKSRLEVLLHEIRHAWDFEFARKLYDIEKECDLYAAMTAQFIIDFAEQGGEKTLNGLRPRGTLEFCEEAAIINRGQHEHKCGIRWVRECAEDADSRGAVAVSGASC